MSDSLVHPTTSLRRALRMTQSVLLIWLDKTIDESDPHDRETIARLRQVVNKVVTFTDGDQCLQFLTNLHAEKACMIISGSLGKLLVPRLQDLTQVDSIFIFCGNKQFHEQWTRDWSKVKGVYTDIKVICSALKQAASDVEQTATNISIMDTREKKVDRLDPMFMYTQIFKEIILTIRFDQQFIANFAEFYRELLQGNEAEVEKVRIFERDYRTKTPIWWCTWLTFLFPLLNRSLRLSSIDTMLELGFLISALHLQIEDLYRRQFSGIQANKRLRLFRGQGMFKEDFEQLSKTKGGLISFNNFLFASEIEGNALDIAGRMILHPDMVGILFDMIVVPSQSTVPFAAIGEVAADEDSRNEVLFSMHTVFRIRDIRAILGTDRVFRVELEMTTDKDKDLQLLTERIREETYPEEGGVSRLGLVLLKLGKPASAEEIYQYLLQEATGESERGLIYRRLGECKRGQGKYTEAIEFHQKSIQLHEKHSPNTPELAKSYNSIGSVYQNLGEYRKALAYHEKALALRRARLPPTHLDVAESEHNIGLMYFNLGENTKALSFLENTLAVQQRALPPHHPDLASTYGNIGLLYGKLRQYPKAISYLEKTLAIQQHSLPPDHPNLSYCYNNLAVLHKNAGEYKTALGFHEKALAILLLTLAPDHPDLGASLNNIGSVYEHMGNDAEAYAFYDKAVNIGEQSLAPQHPHLQLWKSNLEKLKKRTSL